MKERTERVASPRTKSLRKRTAQLFVEFIEFFEASTMVHYLWMVYETSSTKKDRKAP